MTTPRVAAVLLVLAGLALAAPAAAQHRSPGRGHDRFDNSSSVAYENGYREGFEHGEKDARGGRDFAYEHDHTYRDADHGYHRQYGNRDDYRHVFREGYVSGYTDAYQGSHQGRVGRGTRGRAVPRGRYPDSSSRYPDYGRYPSGVYRYDPAWDRGFTDGFEKGLDDGRDNDRYDPTRHKRYRNGAEGYDRQYGSREQYKNAYRQAFRSGYDEGYGQGRRSGPGGRYSRGRRWPLGGFF